MDKKMEENSNFLDQCLQDIVSGETSLDGLLERYPEQAEALRPELEAALWLDERRGAFEPQTGFMTLSRDRLLTQIQVEAAPRQPDRLGVWRAAVADWVAARRPAEVFNGTRPMPVRLALIGLILVSMWFLGDRAFQAAHTSLPGDFFYPLEMFTENSRLTFSFSASRSADLHIQFASRRLVEIQSLVFEGRYDDLARAVVNFDHHMAAAVSAVERVAELDRGQAQSLALALQSELKPHTVLVGYLSYGAPVQSQAEFERVQLISQHSTDELQQLLAPSSGALRILAMGEFDPYLPRAPYSFVGWSSRRNI